MPHSRTVLVAGAGIGGLTAALALARRDFRVVILERAARLEETGAGIQISPNASRVLRDLGLAEALRPLAVEPNEILVRRADGSIITTIPLTDAAFRYGAPYWVVHRADLHRTLLKAATDLPQVSLHLGAKVDDFAVHTRGVTVSIGTRGDRDEHGIALVGADGIWSMVRQRLGHPSQANYTGRVAWRALAPVEKVPAEFRAPKVQLWLGNDAHIVTYPVEGGRVVNIVAVVGDTWNTQEWSTSGQSTEILKRYVGWDPAACNLLATPPIWLKWALNDRSPIARWGEGPVTLLGDAAHPMLPFLAQGGAMAIEDAAVLAACLAQDGPVDANLRAYEAKRTGRTARVQNEARRNNMAYHLTGPAALARNLTLSLLGGMRLLNRYDWLYDWRPS